METVNLSLIVEAGKLSSSTWLASCRLVASFGLSGFCWRARPARSAEWAADEAEKYAFVLLASRMATEATSGAHLATSIDY